MKDLTGKFEEDLNPKRKKRNEVVTREPGNYTLTLLVHYTKEVWPGSRLTFLEWKLMRLFYASRGILAGLTIFIFIAWSTRTEPIFSAPFNVGLFFAVLLSAGFIYVGRCLKLRFFVRFTPEKFQFGRANKRSKQYQLDLDLLTGFSVDEPAEKEVQATVFDVFVMTDEKKYVLLENVGRRFGEELVTKLTALNKEFLETLESEKEEPPVEV